MLQLLMADEADDEESFEFAACLAVDDEAVKDLEVAVDAMVLRRAAASAADEEEEDDENEDDVTPVLDA